MFITIAICTWNRAELLEKTLAQLYKMSIPEGVELEVLVVNNNSTDSTDDVINKYIKKLPLKRIFESNPGLSNARNAAVRNATGEYILWTDDDVLVDQDWLKAYIRAFIKWPEVSVFGGPIEPWFEGTPPKWLQRGWKYIDGAFATRDLGEKSIPLSVENNKLPYGANYAIRMTEQIHFLYDPNLGLKHGEIILGEETKVISDILNIGFSGRWVPEAKVRHWLPISRQTIKYLRTYYMGHGKTVDKLETHMDLVKIFGYPRWAIRRLCELYVSFFFKRVFSPPNIWLPVFIELNVLLGSLKYIRQQNKTKKMGKMVKNIQLNKIDNTKFGQGWWQGKKSCGSYKNYSKKNMVSVIIPTYNRGSVIIDAIESVLKQTYQRLEIIVVDDGSNDNTRSILKQYKERIIYIYQNNAGPGLARNNGIKHAGGKYIAFCDSDDLWEPTKLEEQVCFLEQNKDYALCCTDFRTISGFNHKKIIQNSVNDNMLIKNGYIFSHLLKHQYIKTSTVMVRTEILQHIGMFHEKLRAFEDRYLWFNIARRYKIFFLNRTLATVRIQDDNITNNHKIMYNNFIMLYNNLLSDNKFTVTQKMYIRREIAKRHFNMAYSERIAGNLKISRTLYLKSLSSYPEIWTIIAYFRTFWS